MLFCDSASDWLQQSRNIILHVLQAIIGYVGPALHQAVGLHQDPINTIKLNRMYLSADGGQISSIEKFNSEKMYLNLESEPDKCRKVENTETCHWMGRTLLEVLAETRNLRMKQNCGSVNGTKTPDYN